nr:MFS transporter [Tessaracoccus coleopterorum]
MSDRWGARRVMYATFALMLASSGILMMPNGFITINHPDGAQTQHLHYHMNLFWFVVLVFVLGCAMGFGKAAVFKHIPEYFPTTSARSVASSACSAAWAASSCRRCSPTPRRGRASRRARSSASSSSWPSAPSGCTSPSSRCCTRSPRPGRQHRPTARKGALVSSSTRLETNGDWLVSWDPENEATWDKKLAWNTLIVSTVSLTLCFVAWFLPSAIVPKLNALGYSFTHNQLFLLTSMPGLSGGLLRLVWMVLPPKIGTRKMVSLTTLLLILPMLGWGFEVTNPDVPYWRLLALAFLAGIGGGAFSGFMPSTSFFFPRSKQGTALGIQAGIGNFGVSLVQLLTPWLIGFGLFGFLGSQTLTVPSKEPVEVWYQNAALIYIPIIIVVAIWSWVVLRSVPIKASVKQQFDIFKNQDTWWMTLLYIMTFGTFSGLAAQFALLIINLYGAGNADIVSGTGADATVLIEGYSVVDPVQFVFLGALVSAGARVLFSR